MQHRNKLTILQKKKLLSKYTFVTSVGGIFSDIRKLAPELHLYLFWTELEKIFKVEIASRVAVEATPGHQSPIEIKRNPDYKISSDWVGIRYQLNNTFFHIRDSSKMPMLNIKRYSSQQHFRATHLSALVEATLLISGTGLALQVITQEQVQDCSITRAYNCI